MERVDVHDDANEQEIQLTVFASLDSIVPGSASLNLNSAMPSCKQIMNQATVNDVRRGFFTSKNERSDGQSLCLNATE